MEDANQATERDETSAIPPAEDYARRASSFGAEAAAYAKYRPDYPVAGIEWILAPISGQHGQHGQHGEHAVRLLDLGAGTGKLTAQLAALAINGSQPDVVAVEPDPAMLAELRRNLPEVTAVAGRAEAIPLPDASVDAVLAGQAAHWFDLDLALPEIARVVRPGGVVGGLWNADDDRVAWVAGLHDASGRRTVVPIGGSERDDEGLTGWINQAGKDLFYPARDSEFPHSIARTADSLIATLRTHSIFLIMDPAERERVLDHVRAYLTVTPQTAKGEFSLPLRTLTLRAVRR